MALGAIAETNTPRHSLRSARGFSNVHFDKLRHYIFTLSPMTLHEIEL